MATTLLFAKVLGLYFLVSGVFVVTQQKTLGLILKDMFEHRAITFLIGIILLFGGGALALRPGAGTDSLSVFVTIIAWTIVLKGILYLFAPDTLRKMARNISSTIFTFSGLTIAIIGFYLLFFIG